MSSLQGIVHLFFTTAAEVPGLQNAILAFQIQKGYESPSITTNWKSIAADLDYDYIGDIDIQNAVALGDLVVPDP